MVAPHMTRYWDRLGLKPGAPLDELDAAYFVMADRLSKAPLPEDEVENKRLNELQHAYQVLRRAYEADREKPRKASPALALSLRKLPPQVWAATALLAAAAVLIVLNLSSLRMVVLQYHAGDVLRLKGRGEPYGTVLGFESRHRFAVGGATPAYHVQLANGQDVWVSERVVENGMER